MQQKLFGNSKKLTFGGIMMKKVLLGLVILGLLISCASTQMTSAQMQAFHDFETRYLAFERESIETLSNASDEDLPALFDRYHAELRTMLGSGGLPFRSNHHWSVHSRYYDTRWLKAAQDHFLRRLYINAKNAGNYLVAGNSDWLAFQDNYLIRNICNRVIRANQIAGFDVTRNELGQILSEMQNDARSIEASLNAEQREWIERTTRNLGILGIGVAVASNASVVVIQWRNQLPEQVDLREGIEAWQVRRKLTIERDYNDARERRISAGYYIAN